MSGAWQNVRNNNRRESRTPQNRSSTASPAQASPSQPPEAKWKVVQAPNNVWQQKATERQAAAAAVNGPAPVSTPAHASSESHTPVNAFDVAAAKAFLRRNAMPATYKGSSSSNTTTTTTTNNNNMSNGQSFLKHLAREISKTEAGG